MQGNTLISMSYSFNVVQRACLVCVCVCVCVRADCLPACVHACMHAFVHVSVCDINLKH